MRVDCYPIRMLDEIRLGCELELSCDLETPREAVGRAGRIWLPRRDREERVAQVLKDVIARERLDKERFIEEAVGSPVITARKTSAEEVGSCECGDPERLLGKD